MNRRTRRAIERAERTGKDPGSFIRAYGYHPAYGRTNVTVYIPTTQLRKKYKEKQEDYSCKSRLD
ncbi:MAG: hypothetical protein GX222_00315 [Ruminococcaceae bacterium]|nr:hypothetical protein [Oscillospiraceae bacterium]